MILGLLTQEESGVGTPFWESIPTSIQTLVGVAAILGAGWTWFVRPRMVTIVVEAIARSSKDLREEMDASAGKLRSEIAADRRELSEDIAGVRSEIAADRRELSEDIAGVRSEIAANRDSITEVREMIHASRIEIRDLLAEIRQDNHQAHEAIGERLNGVRTDTAKLTGAVDVLTAVVRGRRDSGATRTP